jgi:ParB family chromosome partitioning protein
MATDTIVRVDPKTLLVGANVRQDTKLTDEFVEHIKDLGVRVPITAYESAEGLVVVDGQRRTLAAVKAGVKEVPVYISEPPTEAERLVDQVVVNGQREELEGDEHVAAVQQLALFDMKVPAIAKRLGLEPYFVEEAVKVGASEAAKAVYAEHHQLDVAAMVAEFEGQPEQAELVVLPSVWQIRDKASALLTKRAQTAVEEQITAAGVTLLAKHPDGSETLQPVRDLFRDAAFTDEVSALSHEDLVALAGDGLVAWVGREWDGGRYQWMPVYGIRGWRELGLHTRPYNIRKTPKPATAEDIEAARVARRVAKEKTAEWVAASVLRVEFLQGLVQRKTMPKGWEPLVAKRLLDGQGSFSTSQLKMMLAILQLKQGSDAHSYRQVVQKHLEKNPTKALQIMLAVECACVEGGGEFDRKGWNPDAEVWHLPPIAERAAYLERLASWGHALTDVEAGVLLAGKKKPAVKK